MSKTTHYELNTPIGSEVLSVMTGLNPNFTAIDGVMYDNETRSTQALNKANVNEQNIATALGRITTAEGDIDTLETGLETANTNISGLTSRMTTAESGLVSANNRIQENTGDIAEINEELLDKSGMLHNNMISTTLKAYAEYPGTGSATINVPKSGFLFIIGRTLGNGSLTVNINNLNIFGLAEFSNDVRVEEISLPIKAGTVLTITYSNAAYEIDLYE